MSIIFLILSLFKEQFAEINSGQSCKDSTILNYYCRVVLTRKLFLFTTLEYQFTIVKCLYDWPLEFDASKDKIV